MTHIYVEATSLADDRTSGIGHSILEIIRALERHPAYLKEFDVTLVTSFDTTSRVARWNFKDVQFQKIILPLRILNLLWKFDFLPPMDVFMKKGVFVFPNYKNWRLSRSKSITYVHDVSFVLFPEFVVPKNQRFLEKHMPKWLNRTNVVAADSNSAQNEILDAYSIPKEKVKVIHHGVDKEVFYKRTTDEVSKVKDKYDIKEKFILYVGNIEPRKNINTMIDAYKQLPAKSRRGRQLLLVGGQGWLNEPINKAIESAQAEGYDVRKLEKYVVDEDLPALYSGAEMLVLVSHYEGFGLSLVQAMACGTPVIAGNNSSMIEVVGDGGILVNQKDSNETAKAMELLLNDTKLRKELIDKGLKQSTKFSWEKSASKVVKISEKLLNQSNVAGG